MASLWKNGNNKLICNSNKTKFIKCDECPCGDDGEYVAIASACDSYDYGGPVTLPGNVYHADSIPSKTPSNKFMIQGRWNLPLVFFWMDHNNDVHIIHTISQTAPQNQSSITVYFTLNMSSVPDGYGLIVGLKWPAGHQVAFYCATIYAKQ